MNIHSDNIANSMEDLRYYFRRFGRHDNNIEFSHQSILSAISELVNAITTMDETILVPCRLMDLKVGDEQDSTAVQKCNIKSKSCTIQDMLNSADLFDVYNMLNSIKVDLLWGQNMDKDVPVVSQTSSGGPGPSAHLNATRHIRRPSTVSVSSTNSTASIISDSESDVGNENDSGIEEGGQAQEHTALLAQNFRRHLQGLTKCLRQMTEASQYITSRYQHDIGSLL